MKWQDDINAPAIDYGGDEFPDPNLKPPRQPDSPEMRAKLDAHRDEWMARQPWNVTRAQRLAS